MLDSNNNEELLLNKRVKAIVKITNQIGNKFESLGVKRKSVLMAAADLGDAYFYADDLRKHINLLLETSPCDWDKLGDIFVELRIIMGELKDHINDARIPLEYLAGLCDKHDSSLKD